MSLLLPVALWAAFAAAEPDSKTEADLRHQLTLSQEQNAALKKEVEKLQLIAAQVPVDLTSELEKANAEIVSLKEKIEELEEKKKPGRPKKTDAATPPAE